MFIYKYLGDFSKLTVTYIIRKFMGQTHLIEWNENCKDKCTEMKMTMIHNWKCFGFQYPLTIYEDFLHDSIKNLMPKV